MALVKGRHKPHPQQKAPPTEGKVSTGLAEMSLFRNGQKAAQSSALSSRLPSFLACGDDLSLEVLLNETVDSSPANTHKFKFITAGDKFTVSSHN